MLILPSTPDPARDFAISVVQTLRNAGYASLWAGGCVRDLLLGINPSDYDIATDATPERVLQLFRRTTHVGISFGVVRILGDKKSGDVEVATFRSDGAYLDGRRPESIRFGSAREDAARRDFTINGMFLDPLNLELIDYVGGRDDLDNLILRAIGDPHPRFVEDKLRLLRAARFAARFDLTIEETTRQAIIAMAHQVTVVAPERIAQELRRMLTHQSRASAITLARDLGLIDVIFPNLASAPAEFWDETLQVLTNLPQETSFPLGLAVLFAELDNGKVMRICQDLKLSNDEQSHVYWLIANVHVIDLMRMPRVATLKRLLSHPYVADLQTWWKAKGVGAGAGAVKLVEFVEAYLRDLPDGPIDPPIILTGRDLIAAGHKPGPAFSVILDAVRTAQLEGEVTSRDLALKWVQDHF